MFMGFSFSYWLLPSATVAVKAIETFRLTGRASASAPWLTDSDGPAGVGYDRIVADRAFVGDVINYETFRLWI
ncbi:hypothetical protein HMPREF3214_01723 [Alloscardovia omnicolens]|nr:hypothetical protein HMPREF3214_01723 [Alloscardovia omnicolens]